MPKLPILLVIIPLAGAAVLSWYYFFRPPKVNVTPATTASAQPIVNIAGVNLTVDKNGLVSNGNLKDKPTLFLPDNFKTTAGQKIEDKNVLFATILAADIAASDFAATNIRFLEPTVVAAYNSRNIIAIFSTQKSAEGQVDSLQQVLSKAKIDASKNDTSLAKIDLRFDKPVVTYGNNDQR